MKVKDIQTLCMKCMKHENYVVGDGVAYCREHFDEMEDNDTTYLSDSAWDKLQEVLDNPPEPNESMKKLMEKFKND